MFDGELVTGEASKEKVVSREGEVSGDAYESSDEDGNEKPKKVISVSDVNLYDIAVISALIECSILVY